jgi:hypothetical protein
VTSFKLSKPISAKKFPKISETVKAVSGALPSVSATILALGTSVFMAM